MASLSDNVSLKTKFTAGQSKFWNRLAPTWKFKVGRFLERIIFGVVKKVLFFLAQVYFNFQVDSSKHSIIIPEFTYSPWLADKKFQEIWPSLRDNTRVDEYKAYSLWQMIEQVKHLEGDLLEVGVWRGGSGCLLAYKCRQEKVDAKVYLCDTYQGVVKAGEKDYFWTGGEVSDTSIERVEKLLRQFSLENFQVLKGMFPEDTGHHLKNKKFRMCHIDVDVYQSAKDTINWVWENLEVGGVIIFDDYGHAQCDGITDLVQEESKKADRFVVHNLAGHAIMVKVREG
jgi:O-methyltransferase